MKTIFFDTDKLTLDYLKDRKLEGTDITFLEDSLSSVANLNFAELKDAEIISVFVHSTSVTADLLKNFPNLRMIATRSTGYNNIDLDYCKQNRIEVCNTPAYGGATVSEFTFGLMLNVIKKISLSAKAFKDTPEPNIDAYMSTDLYGKTLGVLGTGTIGRGTIRIALGFGMNVLAYDPYPNEEVKKMNNVKYVELDELYANSDVITLHIPSTKENYHIISDNAFSRMKNGVYIVNTARGDLIDTASLYQNLLKGKVAGAGLDVLEYENFLIQDDAYTRNSHDFHKEEMFKSLINMKLMQHENVIITPHIAFNSIDAIHRILDMTVENIESFLKGKTINSVLK